MKSVAAANCRRESITTSIPSSSWPIYFAAASGLHFEKSIFSPQAVQLRGRSNSSEKISFSFPHSGHLHMKEDKDLNCSNPGQC
jgi:hypothetical protein